MGLIMHLTELIIDFENKCQALEGLAEQPSLWSDHALKTAQNLRQLQQSDEPDIVTLLDTLHQAQRVRWIYKAGMENHDGFNKEIKNHHTPTWGEFQQLSLHQNAQRELAQTLYNEKMSTGGSVVFNLGQYTNVIGPELIRQSFENQTPFDVDFPDANILRLSLNLAEDSTVDQLAEYYEERFSQANKTIFVRPQVDEYDTVKSNPDKIGRYAGAIHHLRSQKPATDSVLTYIPTRKDAKLEGLPFDKYIKLYLEACNQPWQQICTAQTKLIAELNTGKELRFINTDGTDLRMSIKGFQFANSLTKANMPGSEVFSGMVRNSMNGTLVAKGRFYPPNAGQHIVENLRLEITDGKIQNFKAEKGAQYFQQFLNNDPGNFYFGEIGIGTNPHLKRSLSNSLLVEKISGSFHVALGAAYEFKQYDGQKVHVDNGNRSKDHWDITTMLLGKGGVIELDDRVIMRDGLWIDEAYDVLNRGWAAVPVADRPAYWKKFEGYDANGKAQWQRAPATDVGLKPTN